MHLLMSNLHQPFFLVVVSILVLFNLGTLKYRPTHGADLKVCLNTTESSRRLIVNN